MVNRTGKGPIPNLVVEARKYSALAVDTLVELTKDNHTDSTAWEYGAICGGGDERNSRRTGHIAGDVCASVGLLGCWRNYRLASNGRGGRPDWNRTGNHLAHRQA